MLFFNDIYWIILYKKNNLRHSRSVYAFNVKAKILWEELRKESIYTSTEFISEAIESRGKHRGGD